ncbi:protein OS-9-like isoform X2 [Pomacea canaliculata]|uniref:protein OS-9-like isoform X2 n=1 Tax=Pomacea canaliculata TaxID=400727 RepID=UPI000D733261|nr:protein OS-9-like isoform X2 [Pomacea canaliculata]
MDFFQILSDSKIRISNDKMVAKTSVAIFCFIVFHCAYQSHCFMNIEELQSTNYGIDIVSDPIAISQAVPESAIVVTSRHGQQYQCTYPSTVEQEKQKEEKEKEALEKGVIQLLNPIGIGPCLIKTKDWWSYELCYGKYIRQYHLEDGKIKGNIIYLGLYESEFDWSNETLKETRIRSKTPAGRYHSQYYTNGTKCDLTGMGRQTEVRYLCKEASEDYIARVDEPETCVYILTVYTSRLCSHPDLKAPTLTQPIPITCAPLLSQDEYLHYKHHMEVLRQEEEAARAKAKAIVEQLEKSQAEEEATKENAAMESGLASSLNSILKKTLSKEIKEGSAEPSETKTDNSSPLTWKAIKDIDELEKLLVDPQGILHNMDMNSKNKEKPVKVNTEADPKKEDTGKTETAKSGSERQDSGEEPVKQDKEEEMKTAEQQTKEEGEETDMEMEEFERELEKLRKRQIKSHKRLGSIKERVRAAVVSQFKDIIQEAEEEVGVLANKETALQQLASSLNQLMQKLEETEEEISEMDEEINDMATSKESKKESTDSATTTNVEDDKEEEEQIASEDSAHSRVQAPPAIKQDSSSAPAEKEDTDGRWKFRVRTIKQNEVNADAKLLPKQQKKMLESSVKDGLEKAGVDTGNLKVHVKIITSGHILGDDNEEPIHVLSEEDSASFQNMIVAILGGNNEAEKEYEKHSQLENNYNFVYNKQSSMALTQTASEQPITNDDNDDSSSSQSRSPSTPSETAPGL